jgi:hypothetical protein
VTKTSPDLSRREFLALAGVPLYRRDRVRLAGIPFGVIRNGRSNRRYVLIHGNEETARQVLTAHMQIHAGTAYLVDSRERNVPIASGQVDPNRIFSRAGAEKSLRQLNPTWGEEKLRAALDRLDRGRGALVRALQPPPGGLLITLHNNSAGYSIRDEIPISDQVSLKLPDQPHEFYLCTDPQDFALLAESPYNALLQRRAPPQDDGSLSRLAARLGIRYINLEVALGKFRKQAEMLAWLDHMK